MSFSTWYSAAIPYESSGLVNVAMVCKLMRSLAAERHIFLCSVT